MKYAIVTALFVIPFYLILSAMPAHAVGKAQFCATAADGVELFMKVRRHGVPIYKALEVAKEASGNNKSFVFLVHVAYDATQYQLYITPGEYLTNVYKVCMNKPELFLGDSNG